MTKLPTSSHVSVPLELLNVTSNDVLLFICQGTCLWIEIQFLACLLDYIVSFVGGNVVIVGGEFECFV